MHMVMVVMPVMVFVERGFATRILLADCKARSLGCFGCCSRLQRLARKYTQ